MSQRVGNASAVTAFRTLHNDSVVGRLLGSWCLPKAEGPERLAGDYGFGHWYWTEETYTRKGKAARDNDRMPPIRTEQRRAGFDRHSDTQSRNKL